MKKNNLTLKTLLYFIIFSTIIIISLWILQIQFLQLFYEKYQMSNIANLAETVENNEANIIETLENIAIENDVCIQLYRDNNIIEYNVKRPNCLLGSDNEIIVNQKLQLIKNKKRYVKLLAPKTRTKSIIYAVNLSDGSHVFLNTALEDVHVASTILKRNLIYIVVFLIGLSILVSIFLSKKINKPILNIISTAKEMGKGNYNVKFEKSNIAELDELADVLTVAASEMNKTTELRRDLLANVSHDLKTPLTMIKAYAEKVRDLSYKDKKKMDKDLNIIIEETDRLNGLVNDILDLSKIEAGANTLNITEFDLVEDIKSVIKRYDIIREKEHYKFILDLPKSAIISADQSKISQVIYNLINNAIEHTGDDLTVKVSLKKEKEGYLVSITDSGKGLTEEEKKLVWNKYYKKEKNHKRNVVGTGIGLSIVKGILESHNFEYGIDSKLNEYTTFYFKIKK